jgi:hypothetical protein
LLVLITETTAPVVELTDLLVQFEKYEGGNFAIDSIRKLIEVQMQKN